MKILSIGAALALVLGAAGAEAHHKPGHEGGKPDRPGKNRPNKDKGAEEVKLNIPLTGMHCSAAFQLPAGATVTAVKVDDVEGANGVVVADPGVPGSFTACFDGGSVEVEVKHTRPPEAEAPAGG